MRCRECGRRELQCLSDATDANLYRYVGNSPTNYVDPSGEIALPIIGVISLAGIFIGGVVIPLLADGIAPDGVNAPTIIDGEPERVGDLDRSGQRAVVELVLGLDPRAGLRLGGSVLGTLDNLADDAIRVGSDAFRALPRVINGSTLDEVFVPVTGGFDDLLENASRRIPGLTDDLVSALRPRPGTGGGAIASATDDLLQPAFSRIDSGTPGGRSQADSIAKELGGTTSSDDLKAINDAIKNGDAAGVPRRGDSLGAADEALESSSLGKNTGRGDQSDFANASEDLVSEFTGIPVNRGEGAQQIPGTGKGKFRRPDLKFRGRQGSVRLRGTVNEVKASQVDAAFTTNLNKDASAQIRDEIAFVRRIRAKASLVRDPQLKQKLSNVSLEIFTDLRFPKSKVGRFARLVREGLVSFKKIPRP